MNTLRSEFKIGVLVVTGIVLLVLGVTLGHQGMLLPREFRVLRQELAHFYTLHTWLIL